MVLKKGPILLGTLNKPIIGGGINSSYMYNLSKSQSFQGLVFFTKWHWIHEYMLIYHKFQENY